MFKAMGCAVVFLSLTLLGMGKYNTFFERKRVLESIRDGSVRIENIIRTVCAPLHESFISGGEFYESAAKKIVSGFLPCDAVIDTASSYRCLKNDDLYIIQNFAKGLSADDCEGQLSNIRLFIKSLEISLENAKDELEKRGKLYIKGSILAASAVVLLLI